LSEGLFFSADKTGQNSFDSRPLQLHAVSPLPVSLTQTVAPNYISVQIKRDKIQQLRTKSIHRTYGFITQWLKNHKWHTNLADEIAELIQIAESIGSQTELPNPTIELLRSLKWILFTVRQSVYYDIADNNKNVILQPRQTR